MKAKSTKVKRQVTVDETVWDFFYKRGGTSTSVGMAVVKGQIEAYEKALKSSTKES